MPKQAGLIFFALFLSLSAGHAVAQSVEGLHMEACTEWRNFNGKHYTRNACRRPVMVWFMTLDGSYRDARRLERNEAFDTGIQAERAKDIGWIGATCPAGFRPNVEFDAINKDRFFASDYDCVPN